MGEQMETFVWHSPMKLTSSARWDQFVRLKKILWTWWSENSFFCLFAVWQRGEATAVQIVWAILHDHPICQSLGVWLALWLQFFSGDCVGPWIWIAHTGWLILWGLVLLREKKKFYSHNKSAELFIATNHSTISSHFTGCTVCWNKQSPGSCWECQDAPSSTKAAKHFRKEGDWDISFLKPRSRCCHSTIWSYKCMSLLDLAVIDGSLTLP